MVCRYATFEQIIKEGDGKMQFVSMRDFRTQTTRVWSQLKNGEEIVITNNGRPRAFLVNIPDGLFDKMLDSIRQAQKQAGAIAKQNEPATENEEPLCIQATPDEKKQPRRR